MAEHPISILFSEIAQWAQTQGAIDLPSHPGLWSGETDEWTVEINGHLEEIDGLPYGHARLVHKQFLRLAILSPFGGCIGGGASEGELIEHFRAARTARAH